MEVEQPDTTAAVRIALAVCFAALAALLWAAGPAHAQAGSPATGTPRAWTPDECEEAEAPEEEEAELEEEGEAEEGELEEEECAEGSATPPEECLLRSARARVLTYSSLSRVRLVIRYTSFSPANVAIDYRLNGGRGPLKLGSAKRRFEERGVLRLNERLTDAAMERVRAARRFTVAMDIPAAPRYCRRYETRRLTVRRTVHRRVVWLQSDSVFGTRP
jgi:hypothetical protein